jgi:N-acetylmuramoyl-L-alanine amidase
MAGLVLAVVVLLGLTLFSAACAQGRTGSAVSKSSATSTTATVSATTTVSTPSPETTSSAVPTSVAPQTTATTSPDAAASSSTTATLPAENGQGDGSSGSPPVTAPLIVLDPGHSGTSLTTIDPATQIRDEEYRNTPETKDMFEVAVLLKAKLEAAGYRVLMTKQAWDDTVCKRERVNVANQNHAALAVSLHTSGHTFGQYGQIYVQRMDSYREDIHGKKVYFALPEVAALSAQYGRIFLEERRKMEGPSVVITVNTSWEARGLAPGNLPIVQLFAQVPWILNEAGAPQNERDKERYAESLFNSIVRCVPIGLPGLRD